MDPNELAADLRSLLGRNINVSGSGSHISVNLTSADILAMLQRRPGIEKVKKLQSNRVSADAFLAQHREYSDDLETRMMYCQIVQSRGDDLFKQKDFDAARIMYIDGVTAILGKTFKIPLPPMGGLRNEIYVKADVWEKIALMECCNRLAQCMIELQDLPQVQSDSFLLS